MRHVDRFAKRLNDQNIPIDRWLGEAFDEIERLAKMLKVHQGPDYINCPLTGEAVKTTDILLDLLAIIHHDGGHYIHKHGILKAFEDARNVLATLHAKRKDTQHKDQQC